MFVIRIAAWALTLLTAMAVRGRARTGARAVPKLLCAAGVLLALSPGAWASCVVVGGAPGVFAFSFNFPAFDPTVADGTTLATSTVAASAAIEVDCTTGGNNTYFGTAGTGAQASVGQYGEYATGIPGIGVILSFASGQFPITRSFSYQVNFVYRPTLTATLIKTGDITAGGMLTGEFGQWWISQTTGSPLFAFSLRYNGALSVIPKVPTCTVSTKSVSGNLGPVSSGAFAGAGSTAGAASANVQLSCSGGVTGSTTKLYATMTDATAPANRTNQLSLTPTSTAKGVKVQLSYNGQVLAYGADSAVAGNANQFFVSAAQNGTVTIPIVAKYVATGDPIVAGTANATATMTMSYQ
ncbi:type 1 fimbrial protein [Paraburkholderia tropica]|uniref:fimbrial protein n=1 Tax=Paraburkholderia tropica TaxID=92647 RepID=UPI00160405B7|nr:fimbrial protein [Paraburkholderia tropica]QNB10749.1 type 1 fimbrial protein [Paraburkholderia tropica]